MLQLVIEDFNRIQKLQRLAEGTKEKAKNRKNKNGSSWGAWLKDGGQEDRPKGAASVSPEVPRILLKQRQ